MTKVTNDALVVQLAMDMVGDQDVFNRIAGMNNFLDSINQKTKAAAASDSLRDERMSIEGRYNPDIQRDLEIEKAVELTKRLNLSLEAQDAILGEILEKHRRMSGDPNQYIAGDAPNETMVAAYKANLSSIAADEEKLLEARKRAAKETERLADAELSHSKRASNEMARIRELRADGIIDQKGFLLRARAAKKEYDDAIAAETKIANAKKEAADKQLAQDKADIAKRTAAFHKEYQDRVAARKAMIEASRDEAIEATQRRARAAIEATTEADKEANAARQRAVNILHSLEDATQRYTRTSDELRTHLAAGDITNEEYTAGLENIERRQRSMAGGANNVAYAIGNTVTGLEDFVTVLSITGFGMEGFSAATRSASNNVGQAVRSLGTAASAIYAPLVSIGMVLAGSTIPYLYKYVTGTEDAEESTRKFEEALKSLQRTANYNTEVKLNQLDAELRAKDILGLTDVEDIDAKILDSENKIKRLNLEAAKMIENLEAEAGKKILGNIAGGISQDFNLIVDALGSELQSLDGSGVEVEKKLREEWGAATTRFFENVTTLSAAEARTIFERDIADLQNDIQSAVDSLPSSSRTKVLDAANGYMNSFINLYGMFNDAEVIDQIQAAEKELLSLSKEDSLDVLEKRRDIEAEIADLKLLQIQRTEAEAKVSLKEKEEAEENIEKARLARMEEELKLRDELEAAARAQAEAMHLDQQAMESELEKLKIQQHRNSLLGEENEAERKLLDLALKRKEIMESGLAAPDILEGLMNSELEAIAADLEEKIAKAEELTYAAAAMTEPQAYTSANRQMMEAMKKDDPKQQEMIDLLKAIKDHLSGAATLQVEVI